MGLTTNGAALSLISTIIGSGIVSLPYAMHQAGSVWLGLSIHAMMILSLLGAVVLCLKSKDNLGYM